MNCPNCGNSVLSPRNISGVTIDKCAGCGGAWFDKGELEKLFASAAHRLAIPQEARLGLRRCPACGRSLCTFDYPQTRVAVDMCRDCEGLWLDAGEYQELVAVRGHLAREGQLDPATTVGGTKGALLRFIETAIQSLKKSD
jgi:Zn-finger nucleic acid-binding protein